MAGPTSSDDTDRLHAAFDLHARAILAFALRRCPSAADAADAVAETFVVAWRRIDALPTGNDTLPWLYGVARNVLMNQRRSSVRRGRLTERLSAALGEALAPDHADRVAATSDLSRALGRIDADDREVLLLSAWEGLDVAAIGVVLGTSPTAARSRLFRARARLRTELDRTTLQPLAKESRWT